MKNNRLNRIEAIVAQSRRNKILRRAIALLSVFVLLLTTNTLKFRADTLERIPTCGFGDHVHTEACYDASGMLVCELHEHTDACYQQRPTAEPDVDDAVESGVEGMDFAEVENDVDSEGELTLKEIAERSGVVTEAEEPEFEDVEAESEPVEYVYELGAQGPVKLSEIIEAVGLPVDFRAIEAVGPVEDTDEAMGLVGVDVVDGDYLIYALRDFPEAELAVITADNMYVVKLAFGIAPMREAAEEPVEEQDGAAEDVGVNADDEENTIEENTGAAEETIDEAADETGESVWETIGKAGDDETDAEEAEETGIEDEAPEADGDEADAGKEKTEEADEEKPGEEVEAEEAKEDAEEGADDADAEKESEEGEESEDKEGEEEAEEDSGEEESEEEESEEDAESVAMPPQEFEESAGGVRVTVVAPEGAFPEKTTMQVVDVDDAGTLDSIAGTVEGSDVAVKRVHAVDITFYDADGNEIEPLAPIAVSMSVIGVEVNEDAVVVHVDNEGNAEVVEQDDAAASANEETTVAFTADAFSVYAVVLTESLETRVITASGETYHISVSYGPEAKIPAGATLHAEEIINEDVYNHYFDAAAEMLPSGESIEVARFFDITILSNGEAVQPAAPVEVKVELEEPAEENVHAIHFADSGEAQVLEAGIEDEAVTFSAEGFSVYGVVYTVDFHYEVNGQTFDFSLPGGSFASFRELMGVLGIAQDDPETTDVNELQAFVDDVESVEFSNPELLSVSKVDADTTVGAVKDGLGLVCEYSNDLTEEDIEAIDATGITAVDWALISLKPFASEETLTVTMKNGESFTIQVTDGQLHTYVISDSGDTYKITVTYDDATGIPADAELRARLLTPEDERYQDDIDRSNAALLARYDQEATNPLIFEIKIFANDEEIEPLEGTQVSVEISLALDAMNGEAQGEEGEAEAADEPEGEDAVEGETGEGRLMIDGVEYTLEPTEVDPSETRVVHLTDDGEAEVIEGLNGMVDADNNLVVTFETESFSDYTVQGVYNNSGLSGLPDTIYVGDEIYMQNCPNIWCTNIGSVVSETKYDGDGYKSVRATNTGSFKLTYVQDTNNPGNWWNNNGKTITVLPARSEGDYYGTTPPATIQTVSNASIGMTLNLFDYDLDEYLDNRFNNKDYGNSISTFIDHGINNDHSLKFWGSGITDSSYGSQNNYVEHGVTSIVNNSLSGGYPTLRSDNTSLNYLFTPSDGTDKKAYLNADGLFKKDGDYYVYNSNQNYAWYNPDTNKFEVYEGTYKQKSRTAGGEQVTQLMDKAIGFFPFHEWDDQYDLFVNWNKNLNHHFGLSMSVKFSLPKDPEAVVDTNGNPIVFDFSGDDDLWVFIDGKLAMDIGGIHQPTNGTIDFQNQTVTVNGDSQNFNFNGLYDGELHTLQVFYIERGGCDSNCMIKFNLTQYGHIEFDKVDKDNPTDKLGGAIFGIYKDAACTEPLMERLKNGTSRAYVAESDASGHVKFSDIPLGDYYLKEIKAPDGYPLDSTVHPVKVYLDENSLVKVKVSIDGIDVVDPGVQIPNKKPDPITLGLKKEWKDQNGNIIPAPANTSATFELKRIRTYERITEETTLEGQGAQSSHLVVGWVHNGQYHVHKEYNLIANSQATVSWSYVDGYTGSKDCYVNDTLVNKNEANEIISHALTMPAAGEEATLYIDDESADGEAIKGINVAGEQFYGTSGGGVIHKFETITEPDPDFHYTGDPNVVDNRITLPVEGNTPWEYDFVNLPLVSRTPNTPTTYSYTYYLEEISNTSPAGTTVIYVDRAGNVLNAADDAETNAAGTQTIINQVDLGALELTKNITITDANSQTQPMTEPNQWVNGIVSFTIDGVEDTYTEGIHHDVEITYAAGMITAYKIDTTTTTLDPAVAGTTYSILVKDLVPGDYVIKETGSSNMTLTGITGGNANLTEQTITVTVTHGKNTADELAATAKAEFTNDLEIGPVTATKSWSDNVDHPDIYFKLFYEKDNGVDADGYPIIEDIAVPGVEILIVPEGQIATVTWPDLPKYDENGDEYVYLVKEYILKDGNYVAAAPSGYVKTEDGLTVNNVKAEGYNPTTTYTGLKVWIDPNDATRPNTLQVTLMTGVSPNGTPAINPETHAPYVVQWVKNGDEWTYIFSDLPVFDADGNAIQYYAVETPVNGYTAGDPEVTPTNYQLLEDQEPAHYGRYTSNNSLDIVLAEETDLAYIAIKKDDHSHLVWTQRVATKAEKKRIIQDVNQVNGFIGELHDIDIWPEDPEAHNPHTHTVDFVSGIPIETVFEKGTVIVTKTSDKVYHVVFIKPQQWAQLCWGSYKYNYAPGTTNFSNTRDNTQYDVQKTWGNGQKPPEGAEVQFTLTATIPGTPTEENLNPDPVAIADLSTLGITKSVVTLNGGQKEGEEYTGDDTTDAPWVYKWENLPQYDKNGNKITYSASETSYTIDGETVDITSEGLVPLTTSDGTYELITTNRIPTEEISAHKYWPTGQTVPEGTHIKLTITAKLEGEADPNGVTVTPATVTLDGKVDTDDEDEVETADTLWQYTWTNLPKYDKDGKKIIYTVAETEYKIGDIDYADLLAAANQPEHEGVDFSFTNELPVTQITVEKTWSNGAEEWPDGVSVNMTLKGTIPGEDGEDPVALSTEALVLPAITVGEGEEATTVPQTAKYALSGDETSHTWVNLPMYTLAGKPITYTVDETGMTYTPENGEPIPITNWAQAFTVTKEEDTENNKVTIDNKPLETEISLTKVWTLNGQPKPMEDGDAIEFKLYRTDAQGELTIAQDGYTADKGTATLNKILYVGSGDNPGWQTVTISKLPKYVLKLNDTADDGTIAYYTGVEYYAVETNVTGSTRISYTLSPANAAANSGSGSSEGGEGGEGGEGDGNTGTTGSNAGTAVPTETTDPTQSAIGTGTITIYNRDTEVDINVLKVDATDEDKKLPNAEFQILKWKEEEGGGLYRAYNLETKTFVASEEEIEKSKLLTDDEGMLTFEDLLDGKYKVVETKSPGGYIKVDVGDIFFTIEDGTVTWTDENGVTIGEDNKPGHVEYDKESEDGLTFIVGNTPGAKLPSTGGPGTWAYTLSGLALMAFAVVMLLRRERERDVR